MGCLPFQNKPEPDFSTLDFRKTPEVSNKFSCDSRELSLSFENTPFPIAMSTISAETGVAIVWGKDADNTTISGVYRGAKVYDLLLALAKRNNMQLSDLDGIYYLGTASRSDFVSTVIRSPTSDKEQLQSALAGSLSDLGSISTVGSCVVVSDYLYNVRRVVDMVSQLRDAGIRAYVAELYFIRMKDSDLLDLQVKLSAENVDLFSCSWNLDTLFKAVLNVSSALSRVHVENRPIMYLTEGRQTVLEVGNELTKSQNSISSEGYSTVSGYKTFADGVRIELTPHRLKTEIISLDVKMTVSDFSDSSANLEDIPTAAKSSIDSPGVLLTDGSIYFLGSLRQTKTERGRSFFGISDNKSDEIITVWVKIREISLGNS